MNGDWKFNHSNSIMKYQSDAVFNIKSPFLYSFVTSLNKVADEHRGKSFLFTGFIVYNYFRVHPDMIMRQMPLSYKLAATCFTVVPTCIALTITETDEPLLSFSIEDAKKDTIKKVTINDYISFSLHWLACGLVIFAL